MALRGHHRATGRPRSRSVMPAASPRVGHRASPSGRASPPAPIGRSMQLLKERNIPLFAFQTDAVLFCDDGGVLFLPPGVMRELRGLRPFPMNRDTFESTYNPDVGAEEMVSFALGAVFYRLLPARSPSRVNPWRTSTSRCESSRSFPRRKLPREWLPKHQSSS